MLDAATLISTSPHRPQEIVLKVQARPPGAVDALMGAATAAQRTWGRAPAAHRAAALNGIAAELETRSEELARLVTREVGKPISESRGEVARAMGLARYYAQLALLPDGDVLPASDGDSLLYTRRDPRGVVLAITPWNFPLAIPAWKVLPALAYGNAIILKPASQAIACAAALLEIVQRHVPADIMQVAYGGGDLAQTLIAHGHAAAVTFTGSTPVGRQIAQRAAAHGVLAQCEMGGQNATIVLADADLPRAASVVASAAMGYAGQKCTATSRVIVQADVLDEFRDRLVYAVESLEVGDPNLSKTVVGPVISEQTAADVLHAIDASAGSVLTGGARLDDRPGHYIMPTLVEVKDRDDVLAQQEVFGPVAALMSAYDLDDAIGIANDIEYGLSAAVFTSDIASALSAVRELEAGMVRVNSSTAGVDFHAPFGGIKASTIGPREQGLAARDFFTESRTVLVTP